MGEPVVTKRQVFEPLTAEQKDALRAFAQQNGRLWKEKLSDKWYSASADPILHGLRNTHGPSWLAKLVLDKE